MALDATQIAQVRRWMGYPALGTEPSVAPYVYLSGITRSHELDVRLASLTETEEALIVTAYLTPLATLETDVLAAQTNLDTQTAGPWIANPREIQQRKALYNGVRRDLCAYLGYEPGPGLGAGGMSIVRA